MSTSNLYADYMDDCANRCWDTAFRNLIDTIDRRLSALETERPSIPSPEWMRGIETRLSALEQGNPQPAQPAPAQREWIREPGFSETVWACEKDNSGNWKVHKVWHDNLFPGDLWLPVLSEDEPAPAAPEDE